MRHRRDYLPVAVAAFLLALLSGLGGAWLHDYMEPRAERDAVRYRALTVQPPTREATMYQTYHACRNADESLKAVAERLRQQGTGTHWRDR